MRVSNVFIRDDGKGLVVIRNGIKWEMYPKIVGDDHRLEWAAVAREYRPGHSAVGMGLTIPEAISIGETQL